MNKLLFTLLLFPLISLASYETKQDEGGWVAKDGTRIPNSDNQKSINGFGGYLVVTPDEDWAEKWNTPVLNIPYFSETKEVHYGEKLTILPFYINPKADQSGNISIYCNIRITKPTGKTSIDQNNIPCAVEKLNGDPRNVRLTQTVIHYIGEEKDPAGQWIVELTIIDKNRNISVPLKTTFTLVQ